MLYLMVGGPWHGKWKQFDDTQVHLKYPVRVADPWRPRPFVHESELPDLMDPSEPWHRYVLTRFGIDLQQSPDMSTYIDVMVCVVPIIGLLSLLTDAFHAAVDPTYIPLYEWEGDD